MDAALHMCVRTGYRITVRDLHVHQTHVQMSTSLRGRTRVARTRPTLARPTLALCTDSVKTPCGPVELCGSSSSSTQRSRYSR